MKSVKFAAIVLALSLVACCSKENYKMGNYGYDVKFFEDNNIGSIELFSEDGNQRVLIVPAYQGRVMTSTAEGLKGATFGWINYNYISAGVVNSQFSPVGGEERFWFGPEGGPYSLYFAPGVEQVYANWQVPPVINTESWDIISQNELQAVFAKQTQLTNALGTVMDVAIERTVRLLTPAQAAEVFGFDSADNLSMVAYATDNKVTNIGSETWTKEKGLISIWLLGMFNPTPTTTVFIPYKQDAEGMIVKDDYFGKVPSDRLIVEDGIVYFKIDGKLRSKIGIPAQRAMPICGSYDSSEGVLTLLQTTLPSTPAEYVNSQWGYQENPYEGDAINSYNDGPTDDGTVMGPFYEIETSSPALALSSGASAIHTQCVAHIKADKENIAKIVKTVFGADLEIIATKFVQ